MTRHHRRSSGFPLRLLWLLLSLALIFLIMLRPAIPEPETDPTDAQLSGTSAPATTQPKTTPTESAPPETIPSETAAPTEPPEPIVEVASTISRDLEVSGILLWARDQMREYAEANGLDPDLYFKDLVITYLLNPDARQFCLDYPRYRDKVSTADMSAYEDVEGVPLFLQWDSQWGYFDYDTSPLGLAGCGPTTLAMAAYYFTGDPNMNPLTLAQYAMDNGYRYPGNGTAWAFMYTGAMELGLTSRYLSLDESAMVRALENGELIICIMGPGQFTTSGHFILLTGYEDGSFTVNDCNSPTRSARTWTYEELRGEILELWAIGA